LCPIEKTGSTLWRQLFLRLNGDPHWYEPPWHKRLPEIGTGFTKAEVADIFNNPNWTKSIFFREPAKRLISAYNHLIKNPNTTGGYLQSLQRYQLDRSWSSFWSSASKKNGIMNIHWKPQTDFCSFRKLRNKYNFVGNLEHLSDHGTALLKRVGVYDTYAANGWSLATLIRKPIQHPPVIGRYDHRSPMWYNKGDSMFYKNHATHRGNITLKDGASYIDNNTWNAIRNSEMYKIDYDTFLLIESGPMKHNVYNSYPF